MAFRTQKISQMTPKGANLEGTDLLEVSTIESGSYVTRSITGQELIDAIPPTTIEWGDIGGTLSDQTDLNTALNAKVPTSRTLTINGVTQDLSANRTFTISTGITIGTTAITSGVVGRVLFEGAGNVVQESSSLFWDNTNSRLRIGTNTGSGQALIGDSGLGGDYVGMSFNGTLNSSQWNFLSSSGADKNLFLNRPNGNSIFFMMEGSAYHMQIRSTGNVLIGTTTDAGFRLDVNGTARVSSNISGIYDGLNVRNSAGAANAQARIKFDNDITPTQTTTGGVVFYTSSVFSGFPSSSFGLWNYNSNGVIAFATNSTERLRIFSTGNVGINTTTDAGFRLDVNGTARVSGAFLQGNGSSFTSGISSTSSSSQAFIEISGASGNNSSLAYSKGGSLSTIWQVYTDSSNNYAVFRNGLNREIFKIFESTKNIGIDEVSGSASFTDISSAKLFVNSTTKGFLPPRMTTTQKNAIASPAAGLMVYDTTLNVISYYNGSMWI